MSGSKSFVWLRPATEVETVCDYACRSRFFITVYGLSLCSSIPLNEEMVKVALIHLFRKVPSLRMCFRKKGNALWACEMKNENIDFEVTQTKDLITAAEDLLHYKFSTTDGPLWCARLMPSDAPLPCSQPEEVTSGDFPYTRTLLLVNHHGIADGTTNIFIAESLLHILDDMIAGRPIDDEAQMEKLVGGEVKTTLISQLEVMKNNGNLENMKEEIMNMRKAEKLIPRTFPMPRGPHSKNQIVMKNLDKDITQNFFKMCKQEGVTANSAITAVINVGLVDFVREGGLEQDNYLVHELHAVNLRRYWSQNKHGMLGCHMLMPRHSHSTPAKWRENFWEYARTVHTNIYHGIDNKHAFLYVMDMEDESTVESFFKERPYPESDYGVGNVGNVDDIITTKRQQIRLYHLMRNTSCWNDPMYTLFHTLNGCFTFNLVYCSDVLTRKMAQRLVDITFQNLVAITRRQESITHGNNLNSL